MDVGGLERKLSYMTTCAFPENGADRNVSKFGACDISSLLIYGLPRPRNIIHIKSTNYKCPHLT